MVTMDEFIAESKKIQDKREKYPIRAVKDELLGFAFEMLSGGRHAASILVSYIEVESFAAKKYKKREIKKMIEDDEN